MGLETPQPTPRILSLMPTYQCTAACKSCGTLSSPQATARLTAGQVNRAIAQAAAAGIEVVVFTGGEATLEPDLLFAGLAQVVNLGMASRLVTNAHWAASDASALDFVARLRAAGLSEINYSTGDQHARFLPVEHVLRAVRAAVQAGFAPHVMVETTAAAVVTTELIEAHPYQVETRRRYPGRVIKFNQSPWMPIKPDKTEAYPPGLATDASNLARTRGCDSVLQTTTVQATGAIGACCGLGLRLIPELNLGHIDHVSLNEAIADAENDLLKRWIRLEGPERILAWAAQKDPSIEWEGRYAHRCQACLRLYQDPAVRAVIAEHHQEKVPDLLFGEYLLYQFRPAAAGSDGAAGALPARR
jgi:Radical SAM superfamily